VDAVMQIGFFKAKSKTLFCLAIQKLKSLSFRLGISELLFQVFPNSEMSRYLSPLSQPKTSWLIGYLPLNEAIEIAGIEFSFADLDTY
jgi:hypothetical protein